MSSKAVFGSVIALILLGLFVYLVFTAASFVGCTPRPECGGGFTERMASAMSLIGGLIAALVIAELAITPAGEPPAARALAANPSAGSKTALRWITWGYLAVWVLCGLTALVIGWRSPNDVPALTNLGESWFGLAIAAGYAYFGINPKGV